MELSLELLPLPPHQLSEVGTLIARCPWDFEAQELGLQFVSWKGRKKWKDNHCFEYLGISKIKLRESLR